MSFTDIIKTSVMEGFSYSDITTTIITITLLISFVMAVYIFFVYRFSTKNEFYQPSYGISIVIMSVITAGIILAMQSSLVISLGMVGALSIVRFRTAIKDPLDLLFLFWSIGMGIINGAGLYEVAILTSLMATGGIILFTILPLKYNNYLLSINATMDLSDDELKAFLKLNVKSNKLISKNVNKEGKDYIYEVVLKNKSVSIVV